MKKSVCSCKGLIEKILLWPLDLIEQTCWVEIHSFLGMRRGASLHVPINGGDYAFQMSNRGYEPKGSASAQDFEDAIKIMY